MRDLTGLGSTPPSELPDALSAARTALAESELQQRDRARVLGQLAIIERVSQIARPDWVHVHCLITRLLFNLGERAPAVTSLLRAWVVANAPRARRPAQE
jgi:hypothetical protein